jgi:MerR family transcriptional regulator, Zn(II)-responsive regulator of zntA
MQAAVEQWDASADGAIASDVCSLIESFVDPIAKPKNDRGV